MAKRRTSGQRAGLTRADVLSAARVQLTETGLDGLGIRSVARRLGVSPNALYSHVKSRSAMIDALLDDLLATVIVPDADGQAPGADVAQLMTSTYDTLVSAPELLPAYLTRQGSTGPTVQRLGDAVRTGLLHAGLPRDDANHLLDVLIAFTVGYAAFASSARQDPPPEDRPSKGQHRDNYARGLLWVLAGATAAQRLSSKTNSTDDFSSR
jgi:TetR/AcrR family transcriptional regulator, tetracycline repressor protein